MDVTVTMSTPEIEISNCAKICYATTASKDITKHLVHGNGHLAALRFAYATVHVEGISVACQNQIVRSKHLDFMVQSKRYVDPTKGDFKFIMPTALDSTQEAIMNYHFDQSMAVYNDLITSGVKKEDARAVLPANTSTKMHITGNLQSWWDFFVLRMNKHAQTEIREVAEAIYDELSLLYPQVFMDKTRDVFRNVD